jgi:hypothetical protein
MKNNKLTLSKLRNVIKEEIKFQLTKKNLFESIDSKTLKRILKEDEMGASLGATTSALGGKPNPTISAPDFSENGGIITISKIGYNMPSQANWSYGIFKIDTIDTKEKYSMGYTVRETFGGDSRFRDALQAKNIPIIETKGVYTKTGTQKITGISTIPDIEDQKFIDEIIAWYNKE